MADRKRIVSMVLCIAVCLAFCGPGMEMETKAAGKNLTVVQAKKMAMSNSSSYRKLKTKLTLKKVKYQEAVKSIRLKKKNMSTFRWTPLLSFKFPEKPDLAEEYEFTYKPLQIQSEIGSIQHEMSVVQYDVYETVGNKFTDVYTAQEMIAFYEEQLESSQETLKRNQARLLIGEATKNDITTMEKSIAALESKITGKMRDFEKGKKKLSDMIGLDVTSGYHFVSPYVETSMKRSELEHFQNETLEKDQSYYEAKLNAQMQRVSLDTNYSLMKNQYGKKMNRLDSFVQAAKNGQKVDSDALKVQYDIMLEDVDAPWQGKKRILFIKIPKEWFKGQISGVRYIEDEPYTLYTNILDYQEAVEDEKSAKKELLQSVEDSYDNAITAKNAYETMKKEVDVLKKDADAALLLNKAGDMTYEELSQQQAALEENQIALLDALSTYTQALYSLDGLTCGAVTSTLYAAGSSLSISSGGDSFVTEEVTEGARYYIKTLVEDNLFEVGISIPDGYSLEITSFELWIDGVQIGDRTDADKTIRHLALDKDDTEKVVIRLYDGDTFVDDCVIDPLEYEGPLDVVSGYEGKKTEDLVVADYKSTTSQTTGMMEITITPTVTENVPACYVVKNKEGKQLFGKEPVSIDTPFTYLSLLNGSLADMRVTFYDSDKSELYQAQFDTDTLQLKKITE